MLQKIDKALARSENFINGSLMLLGVIVLTVNVLMRYIFHMASTWVEEALRYSIIWVTFFGSSQCAKNGLHVGIDIFAQSLPETGKRIVTALGQFIAGILCGFCTYAGYFLTTLVMSTMQKSPAIFTSNVVDLPIGSPWICSDDDSLLCCGRCRTSAQKQWNTDDRQRRQR